jgi:hypothetical protein
VTASGSRKKYQIIISRCANNLDWSGCNNFEKAEEQRRKIKNHLSEASERSGESIISSHAGMLTECVHTHRGKNASQHPVQRSLYALGPIMSAEFITNRKLRAEICGACSLTLLTHAAVCGSFLSLAALLALRCIKY